MSDFIIDSLTAGFDDFTPQSVLAKDACTVAENVEFFISTLGERRAGCIEIGLPVGISGNVNLAAAAWAFNHQPTNVESESELWVMTLNNDGTPILYRYSVALGWNTIAWPSANDTPITTNGDGYRVYGLTLHGKMFLAYKSAVDRLHVWDGTTLRRVGLAAHAAAPTVANTGAGAYAAVLRYYRTRSVEKSGALVLRRSEPSTSVSFTPSGAGTAARVTRPTAIAEGETHWEIEASLDNAAFYRLSQIAIGTTTYDDSAATSTYSASPLSDAVGSYTTIPSVRFLSSDDDRLVLGSSWTIAADTSAVRWTPVGNDPLPGPDERLNSNTSPRVDLDSQSNGDLSGLSKVINGSFLGLKTEGVYKLVRTGQLVGSYEAIPLTKVRGALPRSIVEANDEGGRPTTFWIDPHHGPMRLGSEGVQWCGADVKTLFGRINRNAIVPCHGVFYGDKQQLHYWLALDGADYPNTKIVVQINQMQNAVMGARRGWSTVPSPARIATARCSTMFLHNVSNLYVQSPILGLPVWTVSAAQVNNVLQLADRGTQDGFTTGDTAASYVGKIKTRPFFLTHILNRHGIMDGALLGSANSHVLVKAIRDFGTETLSITADMTPEGSETHVIAHMDDLTFSELFAVQFQFEDDPANPSQWQLLQLAVSPREEQS